MKFICIILLMLLIVGCADNITEPTLVSIIEFESQTEPDYPIKFSPKLEKGKTYRLTFSGSVETDYYNLIYIIDAFYYHEPNNNYLDRHDFIIINDGHPEIYIGAYNNNHIYSCLISGNGDALKIKAYIAFNQMRNESSYVNGKLVIKIEEI